MVGLFCHLPLAGPSGIHRNVPAVYGTGLTAPAAHPIINTRASTPQVRLVTPLSVGVGPDLGTKSSTWDSTF